MAYKMFNPNPKGQRVGDCAVRAVAKALGKDWEDAYIGLCSEGLMYGDMPSANYVWGMYLRKYGLEQKMISSICPLCVSVSQFAEDDLNEIVEYYFSLSHNYVEKTISEFEENIMYLQEMF